MGLLFFTEVILYHIFHHSILKFIIIKVCNNMNGFGFYNHVTSWIGSVLCRNCPLRHATEGKVDGGMEVTRRGRRRKKLLDDLAERRECWKLKR
jgi:hypothetical protein